jgi:hypothetical protein
VVLREWNDVRLECADCRPSSDHVSEKTPIPPPDWEALIEVIAKDIIAERSPARILAVRAKLYDLLTHCIPATTILKVTTPLMQIRGERG